MYGSKILELACFMQTFLNCQCDKICAYFFTIKFNLRYEDCYVIFLKTDTI